MDVPRVTCATSANFKNCEIVPLKQFAAGGKCGMYLNYGLVTLDPIVESD